MKKNIYIAVCCLAFALFEHCKQEYYPRVEATGVNALVVEGFINSGMGPTNIRVSRVVGLTNLRDIKPEKGAQVSVEGEDGSSAALIGNINGEYSIPQLSLVNTVKYRLHIKTKDGKEYASDYTALKNTPPIDSISWQKENGGLQLYIHTHDPQNATKYYLWSYEETWEFHSAYFSSLEYRYVYNQPVSVQYRFPDHRFDTTIFKCWKTLNSPSIIIGTSEKLVSDVIYQPLQFIEAGSEKLSVLYSLNLRQNALSHNAYLFFLKMKKNTEQLGTLFDPQPTQLAGNIHCITNPEEMVVGYVEATQERIMRIFLDKNKIGGWDYRSGCALVEVANNAEDIREHPGMYPTQPILVDGFGNILTFYAAFPKCVDCTIGRTNQRPSFWP